MSNKDGVALQDYAKEKKKRKEKKGKSLNSIFHHLII